jgi:carbonic anhydrase
MSLSPLPDRLNRRHLIQYGGGFIGASLMATILGQNLAHAPVVQAQTPNNRDLMPDQALEKLMKGNERFVSQKRLTPNQTSERISAVAESQAPFAAVLSCADSRVPAEMVFDQGIGDLFVCRVAGNIATAEEIGSLEFGSMVLGAKVLMVIGHSRCGAVKAAIEGGRFPGQIGRLIDSIQVGVERARQTTGANKLDAAIKSNVLYQVEKLGQSTVLGELVDKKQLKIVGAYYDLDTGKISLLS